MTEYHSIQSLLDLCKEQEKQVWEVVQQADMEESGATEKQVFEKMHFMYKAMQQADKDYEADLKSPVSYTHLQSYGSTATVVPLVIAAIPFIARMVESSIKEVDPGRCV